MSAGRGKGKRREEHEEHVNHERWLVSFADMMTLLMVLFIVLFAISQVDAKKFAALASGLASGFGSEMNVVNVGGTGVTPESGQVPEPLDIIGQMGPGAPQAVQPGATDADEARAKALLDARARADADATVREARAELDRLDDVKASIEAALAGKGLSDAVKFTVTERGLDVVLVADDLFFRNNSAELQGRGQAVLDALAAPLADIDHDLAVEGHANHLALRGGRYQSNWELSAARAGSVVRFLAAHGIDPTRMSATGFADTRPLVPTSDPTALTTNRRADVLVVSKARPEVRALLPALATGAKEAATPEPAAAPAKAAPAPAADDGH